MGHLPVHLNADGKDSVQQDAVCLLYSRHYMLSHLLLSIGKVKKTGMERLKNHIRGFPGGAVVENPPANAGDTGSSPGL